MKYARVLIEHCPEETTQLFIDYYTGNYRPKANIAAVVEDTVVPASGGLAAGAASAVQNLTNLITLPYMAVQGTASPASQGNIKPPAVEGADVAALVEALPAPTYTPPRPRTAFSSFIDHPDEFIVFLEACLAHPDLSKSDRTDLSTTLFEIVLQKANEKKGDREKWEQKAKELIGSQAQESEISIPISHSNVLLLSHLSNFRDGTTLVKEQSGLLFDIFRSYTSAKDTAGALKALRKYGPDEPQLYPAALSYLTSETRILEEAGPDELAVILARIDNDGLMAPLQVVQTLSKNGVATMGMLKSYLAKTIERERQDIASNRRRAAACRADTEQRRSEMAELGSKPQVFQTTRCSACGLALELPAVHFLCKHSFHQRCLRTGGVGSGSDAEADIGECPQCASDNDTIRAVRKTQEEYAERHELFKDDLERSDKKFDTIAQWFGRGVMAAPPLE
jgi:hypothetical protein